MAFKRPFNCSDELRMSKKPHKSFDTKLISFTQSSTRLDGSASEGRRGNQYQRSGPVKTASQAADIDLRSLVNSGKVEDAGRFMERLHSAIRSRVNSEQGRAKSMTDNLSHCVQIMKTNPQYSYAMLSRVSVDDIPADMKRGFRNFPSEGYICECRVKDVYIGMGLSVSKPGARDKAIEQAMYVMGNRGVTVVPTQRRWRDKNFPDLVLTVAGMRTRTNLPPFFSPPAGTKDFRMEQEKKMYAKHRAEKPRTQYSAEGSSHVHHLGPSVTGQRMENFVILLKHDDENPVGILNTSAQFCKMGADFYYEKAGGGDYDFICTLFIEGQAVADGKGPKKTVKMTVADRALKCLSKICHTVVIADSGIDRGSVMYRKDIKQVESQSLPAVEENSVASRMMKMMGWKEGEGLGSTGEGIVNPVTIKESINKEGLGSKIINSDNITRDEAAEIIKNYASSDSLEELTFSSELNFDERMEIKMMAKRYGLSERTVLENNYGRKKVFLVLSKKIGAEMIIEQLEQEGKWGKYQLVRPQGGDRYVISKYLNYQGLRQTKGVPAEIFDDRKQGFGRSNRGGDSFRNMGGARNFDDRNGIQFSGDAGYSENEGGWNRNSSDRGYRKGASLAHGCGDEIFGQGEGFAGGHSTKRDFQRFGRGGSLRKDSNLERRSDSKSFFGRGGASSVPSNEHFGSCETGPSYASRKSFEQFGRGGGSGRQSSIRPLMSVESAPTSFSSGNEMQNVDFMRSGESQGFNPGTMGVGGELNPMGGRMIGQNSDGWDRHGSGESNYQDSEATGDQFWQRSSYVGDYRGSRNMTMRGRNSNY